MATSAQCNLIAVISLSIIDYGDDNYSASSSMYIQYIWGLPMSPVLIMLIGAVCIQSATIKALDLFVLGSFD